MCVFSKENPVEFVNGKLLWRNVIINDSKSGCTGLFEMIKLPPLIINLRYLGYYGVFHMHMHTTFYFRNDDGMMVIFVSSNVQTNKKPRSHKHIKIICLIFLQIGN